MRVLFVTSDREDYLGDSLLHGLRTVLGDEVIDAPKARALYQGGVGPSTYGRGFTLYGLLPNLALDRSHIPERVSRGEFDLIVFGNIHHSWPQYLALAPSFGKARVAVLDGADSPAPFPYSGSYWRRPECWLLPRVHKRHLYFKRELTTETLRYRWYLAPFAPKDVGRLDGLVRPIAFSIPEEKIIDDAVPCVKSKDFPKHIVDEELVAQLDGHQSGYAFQRESDYVADLRASRFGITTKRAGWDCMRHYEVAAAGAVPCFRDLEQKEPSCAPHGLSSQNCIGYGSALGLLHRVRALHPDDYARLRAGALKWARENTTRARARAFLAHFQG